MSNAEICKKYRSKKAQQKKENDAIRKKLWRQNLKSDPAKYEQYRLSERVRKWQKKTNGETEENVETTPTRPISNEPCSSFSSKQILNRSISRADNNLPKSPNKKAEVIGKLVERYQVKLQFKKKNSGRPRKELNEEEKQWLVSFFISQRHKLHQPWSKRQCLRGKG